MIARIRAWWKQARLEVGSYPSGHLDGWRQLTPHVVRLNAGQRCDMERGPCACGAWH